MGELGLPKSLIAFKIALASEGNAEKIISAADWAPRSEQIKKKCNPSQARDDDYGVAYTILRWPLFVVLTIWIYILLLVYFLIRLWVVTSESMIVWTGRRRMLREKLRKSTTFLEWLNWAEVLDSYLGLVNWKRDPRSLYYDWATVKAVYRELKSLPRGPFYYESEISVVERICTILEGSVKYNFSGIHNPQVFSQCYSGTKYLITEFNNELIKRIDEIKRTNPDILPESVKKQLFRSFKKNIGTSALSLSGGASFSYRHFGVVRELLNEDLLPNIVSGTSGGGLVAALVCTRTNEELKAELTPKLCEKLTACWEKFPHWAIRWWKTGARFDAVDWASRCRWFTMGDLTFKEAYERTGKVLNISTVPADRHTPVMLLNHITSPDCVIWSALLASAAVPGILNPVVLMMKTRSGDFVPYSFGSRYKDGSLRTDIPLQALNTYFNVNFSIVSQVNPHIRLFAYLPRGQVGRPVSHKFSHSRWRGGFMLAALETIVKLEIKKCLKLFRNLELSPRLMNQDWSNVFLQRFEGSVTVWPKIKLKDFWTILSDPNEDQLRVMMDAGEQSMYPKILMIRHFLQLEKAIQY